MSQHTHEIHSYPLLSTDDILQDMADLQIPCTREDIVKPTTARLWPIYEAFLEQLLGMTFDASESLDFSIMEILENPSLHQDSLGVMRFFRKVYVDSDATRYSPFRRRLCQEIGIENFCFQDFLNPRSSRVHETLSALINFSKFRQGRLKLFAKCTLKGVCF